MIGPNFARPPILYLKRSALPAMLKSGEIMQINGRLAPHVWAWWANNDRPGRIDRLRASQVRISRRAHIALSGVLKPACGLR